MRIERTDWFKKDYQGLPEEVKEGTERAIQLLLTNPRHPSLRAKRGSGGQGYLRSQRYPQIPYGYHMTFEWEEEVLRLRQVGTYDILKSP
jgi:mRNA interferase RelE/StbE